MVCFQIMKLLLKLLLPLCILTAGIFAATPLWLPYIFTRQLPPDWQLEKLEAGYPGISGINIRALHVKGAFQTVGLALTASNIRFNYLGLKTEIDSLSLEVFMQAKQDNTAGTLTLDDLSLPVTRLTGKLPEISVRQLQVVLHNSINIKPGDTGTTRPLVLDFQAFKLLPLANNNFDLSSVVSFEGIPGVIGQLDAKLKANSREARIRFPSAANSPPWLSVSLEQTDHSLNTTTRVQAVLDTRAMEQEWLDQILARSTGGLLIHVDGKLMAQADFAGKELQDIEHLLLTTEDLRIESESGALTLNTELLAAREGEKVTVSLLKPTEIRFQDTSGKIDELIATVIPGLQRTPQPSAMVLTEIKPTSKFVIHPGSGLSMEFNGEINLDMISTATDANFQFTDFQIEIEDFYRLESTTANGLITLNWEEHAAFTYTSDDISLEAEKLSVTAELISSERGMMSTGSGTLTGGHITPPDTSTTVIDIAWQDLDLLNLAGKISTRTHGFATEFDAETWTGFDFDIAFDLLSNTDINGSGTLKFDSGPDFPIEFAGNAQAQRWIITLPSTSIKLTQLERLLRVAHFDLPTSIKLADGYINMQGEVIVDDEITAEMAISGYELDASMLESSASKASFIFNTSYERTISASGPVSIESVALAGGIDVQHIKAGVNIENPETFSLSKLYAEVFDGQLNIDSLRFSDNGIEDTTAELGHINLAHLLAFADIDGLEGTGLLEISLPLGSDQTGIYIKNGLFNSSGPGRLAYTKEGVAHGNIGLQALENFQYQELSGTVDYQSDGSYRIALRLEGNNPDLYEGHPIVFNLNISGSLPELFEALFITGDFEEAMLKQIGID